MKAWMDGEPVVRATHHGIDEIEERDERDEHGANIESEMKAVDRAARDGAEKIGVLLHFGHFNAAGSERLLGFGHEHFGHEQSARRGHDDGGEKMLGFDAKGNVGGHDAAGDMSHAARHDDHELGFCELI